jgi:hypothetical protein
MRRRLMALAIGVIGVTSAQAVARDMPPAQPLRDVTVEYSLLDSDNPKELPRARPLKVFWAKGGAKMRIQMQDERAYAVLDRDAKRMTLVLLDQRGYVELSYDAQRLTGFTVPPGLALVAGDSVIVSGNACTLWHAKFNQGNGNLCVTDHGVLLRAQGYDVNHCGDLEATSIIYGPQPASVFAPPPDFRKLEIAPPAEQAAPPAAPSRKPG